MIAQGALPPDLFTALAALFLLFGVPLILFGLIMLYTGYVQYDGERYIEELEEEAGLSEGSNVSAEESSAVAGTDTSSDGEDDSSES
ncbi:hypothetical protein EL22_06585 [Halostagnicola sp. A56]|uniref:hypothetical protein n=1 Tax=Halostagnicola sp. A56 TaxID=1495067 RepID=UPI0004A025F1|nr:hypothetical protein [Halostagnicola sp. A56]KDE58179.1 hypothetical protein EL22_06585 [Halostagnicola sp. A56]